MTSIYLFQIFLQPFDTGEYCESMSSRPKSVNANNIHQHQHLGWISKGFKGSLSHRTSAATGTASNFTDSPCSQSQSLPDCATY